MDQSIIHDIANSVAKYKMYPFFNGCNYILMSMAVREDTPQSGNVQFSRRHPFASWFATMIMCFAGNILASFLLGDSILSTLQEVNDILLATFCWYIVNYFPFDIFYKLNRFMPIRLIVCVLKEIQRTKKIYLGVKMASRKHPGNVLLWLTIGMIKGSGYSQLKIIERLIRGVWLPASNEFLKPSFTTKSSLTVSLLFVLVHLKLITIGSNLDFLIAMGFLIYFRIIILLLGIHDPYAPFENIICGIFFGGLVDAARNAWGKVSKTDLKTASIMKSKIISENGSGNSVGNQNFGENSNIKDERKKDL